jgi:ornithine decarboxylase
MRNNGRFLLSKKKTIEQYDAVRSMCDIVSYSFKTNFEIGHVLEQESDCMFSIHSIESVKMLKDRSRLIHLAQGWDDAEISELFLLGVDKFIVDNLSDLEILLNFIEKNNKSIWLFLRMRLREHTIQTGKYYVYGMKADMINEWVPKLAANKHITNLGIHFHRKTQNISEWSLKYELESLLSKETLDAIDYLNIGGGLPVRYKNYRLDVESQIFGHIKDLREWLGDVKLMIEPGRFIAGPPIVLEADIMIIYDNNIIVNCSVWNAAMDTFVANIRLLVEGELEDGKGIPYTIKGNSPDSMDILRYRVFLPEQKVGAKIRFLNAGAYNFHTNFCNLPKLETVIVD